MSMGGSPPTPPSPSSLIGPSRTAAEQQQAGSQYNQGNYYGGINYAQTGTGPGGVPLYTATTSFSPSQLQAANQTTGTQLEAGSQAANTLGFGNYGTISPSQQIGDMTSGRTGQMMGTWLGSQIPFFNTQTSQLDTQLKNEGLQPGNPAYDVAMRQLQTNQGLGVAGAASQFEPAAFNQASQLYNLPATMGQQLAQWGAPISPTGQFTKDLPGLQMSSMMTPMEQMAALQYQAQQAQYNAQQSAMGGLMGMGGDALALMAAPMTGGLSLMMPALMQGANFSSASQYAPGGSAYGATPTAVNGGVYPMFA